MPEPDQINVLVAAVRAGARYRNMSEDLIRRIGLQELTKRRTLKEAVKATRSKLHQVSGVYQEEQPSYDNWREKLVETGHTTDEPSLQAFCRLMMAIHTSTRERLSTLHTFFTTTLESIAPVHSVLDLGCGLNPLAIPWMPLAADARYDTCDIYEDLVGFLRDFMAHIHQKGEVECCDIVQSIPNRRAQLALLLKTIPCLEQQDKDVAFHLLQNIQADHILISFPAHSLGGASRGMIKNYEAHFMSTIEGQSWKILRFQFVSELAFLLSR